MKPPASVVAETKTRYAIKRFAIKLGMITLAGAAQSWMPWGIGRAFAALTGFSATIDVVLAVYFRERPVLRTFSYSDEAAVFLVLCLVTSLVLMR